MKLILQIVPKVCLKMQTLYFRNQTVSSTKVPGGGGSSTFPFLSTICGPQFHE